LLENIKRQYPYIFQVVRESSSILQKKINLDIPEEEIAFITLHLGAAVERLRHQFRTKKRILVVCSEGTATAWLLVSKIRAEFTDIEIVQVMSLQELRKNRVSRSDIDAIVSTVPLEFGDTPVITVNPLLQIADITRLKEALGFIIRSDFEKTEDFTPYFGKSLADLLTTDKIMLQVGAQSWQDVVEKAGELLIKTDTIELAYVAAMKRIIVEYGPYAVTWPGVVLLHARPNEGVKCLCMSLITLKTPVQFGHPENDPVDVAFVLGAVDTSSHLRALKELSDLMTDMNAITKIRQSSDPTEVRTILSHFALDEHDKAIDEF
jgi:mannitol operon transcriptional antiterminator